MGKFRPPEIVAELSGNHNGTLDRALQLVETAARVGVDAIKIQTYTPDTITLDSNAAPFLIPANHALWGGRKLFDLYQEAHTPWDWHKPIFTRAAELGLDFFSTPFDETAVDFLESLEVSRYKIASLEIVDLPLISKVATTGKPMILSTGASTLEEVAAAVESAKSSGCEDLTLLVCSSVYPAKSESSNLASMSSLRKKFGVKVGFSDHTLGIGASIAAATLGATIIEKHLTLDPEGDGPDDKFSASPRDFETLVREIPAAVLAIGLKKFGFDPDEALSRRLRPSLWIVKSVKMGDFVSDNNVKSLRPSGGLPPGDLPALIGSRFSADLTAGTALLLSHIEV